MKQKEAKAKPSIWRRYWPSEAESARNLRRVLFAIGHYPPSEIQDLVEKRSANVEAVLQIIPELDYLDIETLYRVARLMAIAPRDVSLFQQRWGQGVILS